jgi:hypothetical protein
VLFLLTTGFIAADSALAQLTNDSHFALASWWLTKAYLASHSPPEIVVLGDSQLGSVKAADAYVYNDLVDTTSHHRSNTIQHDLKTITHMDWKVLVGGLPGTMISDQLLISHALFLPQYKPKLIIVMFSPRDFIDNNRSSVTDGEAFSFFSKHAFLGIDSALFSVDQKKDASVSQILSCKTMEKARIESNKLKAINIKYSDRISPLTLGKPFELICPGEKIICPGDRYLFYDSSEDYRKRYENPYGKQFTLQLRCLDSLFRYLRQQDIEVSAIELPLTNANHILLPETFWQFYKKRIREICHKHGVDYWDVESIWDNDIRDYCDSVHLNAVGGLKLTRSIVLATIYKFHLPMYAYNGNFGPLVPGKEKIYFHRTWTGAQKLSVYR